MYVEQGLRKCGEASHSPLGKHAMKNKDSWDKVKSGVSVGFKNGCFGRFQKRVFQLFPEMGVSVSF